MQNLSSFITAAVMLLLILAFAAWVIKRRFIDKKSVGGGSQFVGRHILMQFQDADKKNATEQVIMQEEERKQYFAADDKDPESEPEE